jgi:hypothetical protein
MYEQDKRIELMCSRVDFRVRVGWKGVGQESRVVKCRKARRIYDMVKALV